MKTRIIVIVILLLTLTVLLSRNNERITNMFLGAINPIKQSYKNFTQNIEDKSHSYIFQKESIEKLSSENRILRKRLLSQMHYIEEVKNIYNILPELNRLPVSVISIVETISYVKLNSFSQIILTKPNNLKENKLYGIIQNSVVAGIAKVKNNQLYGYLTSDKKCRFSVFIGDKKAPGIAIGRRASEMIIKFIPKWHNVQIGDKVYTSGLDNIFFTDIPVGVVDKVEVQSSYTVAYIKTYSDVFHPKTFFLIDDAQERLAEGFDSKEINITKPKSNKIIENENKDIDRNITNIPVVENENNKTKPAISSIPAKIDQTQENLIEPEAIEEHSTVKIVKKKPAKQKRKQAILDLF